MPTNISTTISVRKSERECTASAIIAELCPTIPATNLKASKAALPMLPAKVTPNIFLSLYARNTSRAKSVAKVGHIDYSSVLEKMDLGSVVNPKSLTAERIVSFVRAMQNSIGSNVETLYHLIENKVEALEFAIQEGAPVVDIPLADLKTKSDVLIAAINRGGNGDIFIPNGQSQVKVGDRVVVVTTHSGFRDIKDILA